MTFCLRQMSLRLLTDGDTELKASLDTVKRPGQEQQGASAGPEIFVFIYPENVALGGKNMAKLYVKLTDPQLVVSFQKFCGVDSPVWHQKSQRYEGKEDRNPQREFCQNGTPVHSSNGAHPKTLNQLNGSSSSIPNGSQNFRKRVEGKNGFSKEVVDGQRNGVVANGHTHDLEETQVNGNAGEKSKKPEGIANAKVAMVAELLNDTLGEELQTDSNIEYKIHNKFLYYLFNIGANLGNEAFYICFFPTLIWNMDGLIARKMLVFWCLYMYIGQATKDILKIPRPPSPPVVRIEKRYALEYGMPSTHAMTGLGMPFTILYLAYGRYEFPFVIGFSIAAVWCVVVGLSRLYLGMHTILDIISGLTYTLFLMPIYYLWVMDAIDDLTQNHPYAPALLIGVPLLWCLTYPKLEQWSTARGDTTLVLGTGVGQALGHWWSKRQGIMHPGPPVSAMPLPIVVPTLFSFTLSCARLLVGITIVLISRFVVKNVVYEISCWLSGIDRKNPKAKEQLAVELPCKYITYISLGVICVVACPALFTYLGIQRESFYYEL